MNLPGGYTGLRRKVTTTVTSYAFTKGLLLVGAVASAVALGSYLGNLTAGVSGAVGVFLVTICDLPGNKADHLANMLLGLFLAVGNLMLIQLSLVNEYLNLAVLPVLVFLTAYLSILGKRASLVSFSGLLALVLAYAFPATGADIVRGGLYMSLGGLWFIFLNVAVHSPRYRRYRLSLLNDALELTADYLELRSQQLRAADPNDLWPELIRKHNAINEIRKVLTDYFLGQSPRRDTLGRQSREGVLYVELVDLVELGTAVPVRPESDPDPALTADLSSVLEAVAAGLRRVARKSAQFRSDKPAVLDERLGSIALLLRSGAKTMDAEHLHYAYLVYDNLEKQVAKLRAIEALGDASGEISHALYTRRARARLRMARPLLATLRQHLSKDSPLFRHCVRLALVMVLGYAVGRLLSVQNVYWIMLTVVVIMRPTYVQSRERSVQRTVGTLMGAVVAGGIVTLTDNPTVYAVVGATAMPFVFLYLERNYRLAAFFVTLNLVFTYALLKPDAYTVIAYRVVDTLIGAALAFAASRLLWPAWDSESIAGPIAQAIAGNAGYLREEATLFSRREEDSLAYRVARREAFVNLGELDAAYVRVLQEPGRKRLSHEQLRRLVTVNHRILSVVAWMGTFLQYHAGSMAPAFVTGEITELSDRLTACHRAVTEIDEPAKAAPTTRMEIMPTSEANDDLRYRQTFLRECRHLRLLIDELEQALVPLRGIRNGQGVENRPYSGTN